MTSAPLSEAPLSGWTATRAGEVWITIGPADLNAERNRARVPDRVISLHEMDEPTPDWVQRRMNAGRPTLRTPFSDIPEFHPSVPEFIPPTREELERLTLWGAQTQGWLHVHCAAGISRSSAVALGVIDRLCPHLGLKALHALLLEANPYARPNDHLLTLLSQTSGRNFHLLDWHWRGKDNTDGMFAAP